jgi:hypothetical protein
MERAIWAQGLRKKLEAGKNEITIVVRKVESSKKK